MHLESHCCFYYQASDHFLHLLIMILLEIPVFRTSSEVCYNKFLFSEISFCKTIKTLLQVQFVYLSKTKYHKKTTTYYIRKLNARSVSMFVNYLIRQEGASLSLIPISPRLSGGGVKRFRVCLNPCFDTSTSN